MAEVEEYLNSGDYEMKKPAYTKEMHERGELPPVGSEVKVSSGSGVVRLDQDEHGFLCILVNGEYCLISKDAIKPIPTIEDDIAGIIHQFCDESTFKDSNIAAKKILTKYNITPKG